MIYKFFVSLVNYNGKSVDLINYNQLIINIL